MSAEDLDRGNERRLDEDSLSHLFKPGRRNSGFGTEGGIAAMSMWLGYTRNASFSVASRIGTQLEVVGIMAPWEKNGLSAHEIQRVFTSGGGEDNLHTNPRRSQDLFLLTSII